MLEGYGTKKSAIEAQCARKTPHWHLDLPGRWIKNGELSDGGKCTDCTGRFSMSRHLQWYMMIYVWYSDICIIYICMYMAILCTLSILATAHHLVKRCTQLTLCKDHVSDCCLDNIPVWLPGYKHSNTQKEKKFWPFLKWSHMSHAFLLVWWKTVRSGDSNGPSTSAASIRLMCLFADRNQWKCAKHLKKKIIFILKIPEAAVSN